MESVFFMAPSAEAFFSHSFPTGHWLPGKRVLAAFAWTDPISWADQPVVMALTQETIRSASAYGPYNGITPEYIVDLLEHCGNTRS